MRRFLGVALVAAVLGAVSVSGAGAAPWDSPLGDAARTGYAPITVAPAPPQLLWETTIPSGRELQGGDGVVLVEDTFDSVIAMDAASGDTLWTHPNASGLYAYGRVYVSYSEWPHQTGFRILDARSGEVLVDQPHTVGASSVDEGVLLTPELGIDPIYGSLLYGPVPEPDGFAARDGKSYASFQSSWIYAPFLRTRDVVTGQILSNQPFRDDLRSLQITEQGKILAEGRYDDRYYIDPQAGTEVVLGDYVQMVTAHGAAFGVTGRRNPTTVNRIALPSGSVEWTWGDVPETGHITNVIVTDNAVVFAVNEYEGATLYALAVDTGAPLWSLEVPWLDEIAIIDDKLVTIEGQDGFAAYSLTGSDRPLLQASSLVADLSISGQLDIDLQAAGAGEISIETVSTSSPSFTVDPAPTTVTSSGTTMTVRTSGAATRGDLEIFHDGANSPLVVALSSVPTPGSISGTVTGLYEGATQAWEITTCVEAIDVQTAAVVASTTNGINGYQLDVPPGTYSVRFGCPAEQWVREYYDDRPMTLGSANWVEVAPGAAVAGIDAELTQGQTLEFRVTDAVTSGPALGVCAAVYNDQLELIADPQIYGGTRAVTVPYEAESVLFYTCTAAGDYEPEWWSHQNYVAGPLSLSSLGPDTLEAQMEPYAHLPDDSVALFDPFTGIWVMRRPGGMASFFYYGVPGDVPLLGDWDCDGLDTVGMYRPSNGFVYLRNSNTQGFADVSFYFGQAGDVPLAGDWDGDGCDTLSIYRAPEGKVYISNELATTVAESEFYFGVPGDRPFAGDWDGDGVDSIGLYRESTGFVYQRNELTSGVADQSFFYGDPLDMILAGDWDGDGDDTVGVFRPDYNARGGRFPVDDSAFMLRNENSQGVADVQFPYGLWFLEAVAGATS